MHLRDLRLLTAGCLSFLCAVTAGCGAAAVSTIGSTGAPDTQRPAQTGRSHPAWWREAPDTVKRGVYVSESNGGGTSELFGFGAQNQKDHRPFCVTAAPASTTGIGSDASGNVYAPSASTATVSVYAPHCGSVIATFSDPYGSPLGAAVQGDAIYLPNANGNVAVCTLTGCASELTDPSILQVTSAAADPSGNVWAAYYAQNIEISLIVWRRGKMPGRVVSGYINTPVPGNVLFDKKGGLISVAFATAFTYSCSARAAACTNTGAIGLQGNSNFAALNATNTAIQVTDAMHTSVDVYAYPSFTYAYSYDSGLLDNAAVEGITQTILPL